MKHLTLPRFWQHYQQLPKAVQALADKQYALLQIDPSHPSLQLKKVGKTKQLWSVRVSAQYRALGVEKPEGWCGSGSARMLSMTNYWHSLQHDLSHSPSFRSVERPHAGSSRCTRMLDCSTLPGNSILLKT